MKFGPGTEFDKRNKTTSKKKIEDDVMPENCYVIVIFFRFMASLEQSGCQIPDAQSANCSLQLSQYCIIFAKKDVDIKTRGPWH